MTLVVGLKTARGLQLLSDTRISHPDVTQTEEIPGRLKLIVLRDNLCVAYAGRADYAIDEIRRLATSEWITPTDAALRLLDVNVESGGAIDFLVASTGPGPRLVLVREGQTADVSTEAWIGDAEAAHVFERLKSTTDVPPGTPPERENLIRSLDAFSAVLEAPEAPTVAGLKMRVDLAPAGFVYLDGALAYCPRQTIPSGVATTLQFGGPAQGGFAYTILVPEQPGVAIVAVHFYQGRLGYVYAPLQADRPVKVPDVDHDGLQAYVGEQFGVQVLGLKIG